MNKEFNKGLFLAGLGSFWWGFFGVLYFKYITYIGHIELVVHRCLWTTFTLIITTFLFSKYRADYCARWHSDISWRGGDNRGWV